MRITLVCQKNSNSNRRIREAYRSNLSLLSRSKCSCSQSIFGQLQVWERYQTIARPVSVTWGVDRKSKELARCYFWRHFHAIDRDSSDLQYPPKVLGHFANFKSGRHIRPPPPPKQCWILSEVHAVPEKVFAHNNAKCLRNRPTLY